MQRRKKYSDKQKVAYYKKLATQNTIVGRGAYKKSPKKRIMQRYKGRGDYVKSGERIGSQIGAGLGRLGGEVVKYFLGRGDYQVKSNSLLEGHSSMPYVINKINKPGATIIRRCEYITDIISSSSANTFKNQNYSLNPALQSTGLGPWIAQIAANWEEYELIGCYFEFKSMSANALNSVNTALGTICLACDFNASNANFATLQEMQNYENAISIKPSENVRYFVECSPRATPITELYTRTGVLSANQDIKLYDLGSMQIASAGCQGTSVNLGQLWVCYELALLKPKLFQALGNSNLWCASSSGTFANATPFGSQTINDGNLALTFTGTTITFPFSSTTQSFYIQFLWFGTGAVASAFSTLTLSSGITGPQRAASVPLNGETCSKMQYSFEIQIAANNTSNVLTIGAGGTLPTSPSSMYIIVNQMPNAYFDQSL